MKIQRLVLYLITFVVPAFGYSQTGIGDNFNNNSLSCNWTGNSNNTLSDAGGQLGIVGNNAGASYNNFTFKFPSINLTTNPVISVQIKTTSAVTVRIDLMDINGNSTNSTAVTNNITGSGTFTTFTFTYTGKFSQSSPTSATVDQTQIVEAIIFLNAGGSGYNGTVYFDNFQIGTGGVQDGGGSTCPLPINYNIRLNQIGFYPNLEKIAIVAGNPAAGSFMVQSTDLATTYFTGTLGASSYWSFSNETVRAADFSAFTTPGTYVVNVPGVGYSPSFTIKSNVLHTLSKAAIKAYYFKRASTAITAANAGVYARAEGHPDTDVQIHSSAASPTRPAGTVVAAPKGWYDAGDFGSYTVNSGIATFTLLSAYEHFSSYFDTLNLNIPESGNGMPDILNEVKWNLDWLLLMQDPYDNGVYHKKTTAAFSPFEMPAADNAQRYLVGKATAATFDFAALMAVAYRVYLPYNATYANQCLTAAKAAYVWGVANPNLPFTNPSGISTGEYGDDTLTDEMEWAATELYISTQNDSYYANSYKITNKYELPQWANVNTLGVISLVHNRKKLTALGFADTTNIKNTLFTMANAINNYKTNTSPYKCGMGTYGIIDYSWGSNSFALNEGFISLAAYQATSNITYLNSAVAEMDYILGRNATTYNFVSSFGSKQVMNPSDRISADDGIVNPVPGWMAGGPNLADQADCGSGAYPSSTYSAIAYYDNVCSYSTNEIAINWNAPLLFVSAGLEYTNLTVTTLPVTLLSFAGTKSRNKNLLTWTSASEKNFQHYELQYSYSGENFSTLSSISAQGGNLMHTYSVIDSSVNATRDTYYRLKMIDLNGNVSNSSVVYLTSGELPLDNILRIYPNPTQGNVTLEVLADYNLTVSLYNELGLSLWTGNVSSTSEIPTQSFAPGMYILKISNGEQIWNRKIVKY